MNAIDISLKMETDAIKFYNEAAKKTSHPLGKRMFLSIMEDEKRHYEMIKAIQEGMGITADKIDPMKKIKTVFEEMKAEMQAGIQATSDETAALEMAMKMEKEGYEFYKKIAKEGPDQKSRELFSRLVEEEEKHYEIFSNTLNFLNDTGNWFMWEEKGIVEGG